MHLGRRPTARPHARHLGQSLGFPTCWARSLHSVGARKSRPGGPSGRGPRSSPTPWRRPRAGLPPRRPERDLPGPAVGSAPRAVRPGWRGGGLGLRASGARCHVARPRPFGGIRAALRAAASLIIRQQRRRFLVTSRATANSRAPGPAPGCRGPAPRCRILGGRCNHSRAQSAGKASAPWRLRPGAALRCPVRSLPLSRAAFYSLGKCNRRNEIIARWLAKARLWHIIEQKRDDRTHSEARSALRKMMQAMRRGNPHF